MSYRSEASSLEARIEVLKQHEAERRQEVAARRAALALLKAEDRQRHSRSRRWLVWWSLALLGAGLMWAVGTQTWLAGTCALLGCIFGTTSVVNAHGRGDRRARFWACVAVVGSGTMLLLLSSLGPAAG